MTPSEAQRASLHPDTGWISGPPIVPNREIVVGDIRIDRDAMLVWIDGQPLDLTLQQYEVLLHLALDEGAPVSQIRLAHVLWQGLPEQYRRNLSVLIARLRAKLSASRQYRLITVHKRGYALVPFSPDPVHPTRQGRP